MIHLNPEQRRAVEHPSAPVLAGPRTGKTGVLISRIVHLIEERNVEPCRILALKSLLRPETMRDGEGGGRHET